ncbi:MAG: hypothetical protein QOI00_631 [Chloroflexota bacterium]|jgi:hypothetical protein|nr:hypothetical protein [Chloroflexota bacterium]MEA2605874.1 hypothetical protein [Chloroflexota bacterium]
MIKRILLALALAGSLGGAVLACTSPAATGTPAIVAPSTAPAASSPASSPAASDMLPSPSAS